MENYIKRHFYNNREYHLDFKEKKLILNKNFHQKLLAKKLWNKFGFKKIGGSNIAEILETDNFKSPFRAFARMSWLDLPILDRKYLDAGIAIEPKVVELIAKQKNIQEIETFDAMTYNFDFFKDNKIFGGLPDGLTKPHNIVIEIKTTGRKNLERWIQYGVPVGYLKQASLYTYLMNLSQFAIVATFLEEEDYADPKNYLIQNRKTRTWFYKLNKPEILDDMEFVKKWYLEKTTSGNSPSWNEQVDGDLIDFLKCENENEWKELIKKWSNANKINWKSLQRG